MGDAVLSSWTSLRRWIRIFEIRSFCRYRRVSVGRLTCVVNALADFNWLSEGFCFDLRKELLTAVNCRKTIWIMATNAFDETIHAFCNTHEAVLFSDEPGQKGQRLVQKLSGSIRNESKTNFGVSDHRTEVRTPKPWY